MKIRRPTSIHWQCSNGVISLPELYEYKMWGPFTAIHNDRDAMRALEVSEWVVIDKNGDVRYESSSESSAKKVADQWNEKLAELLLVEGTAADPLKKTRAIPWWPR